MKTVVNKTLDMRASAAGLNQYVVPTLGYQKKWCSDATTSLLLLIINIAHDQVIGIVGYKFPV